MSQKCERASCNRTVVKGSRFCDDHGPQLPLFEQNPPVVARRTDPGTSWEAAKSVNTQRPGHLAIMAALTEYGPMTDEWIYRRVRQAGMKISPSGARTRRKELERVGRVRDTGDTGVTDGGRRTKVWEAVKSET